MKQFCKKATKKSKEGTLRKDELEAAIGNPDDLVKVDEGKGHKKAKAAGASSQSMSCGLGQASQVRKRQAISHPFWIERLLRGSFEPQDLEDLMDALNQVGSKQTIIQQIRSKMEDGCDMSRYETGLQLLQQRDEVMFGKYFDMKTLLTLARCESSLRGNDCLFCEKPPVDPVHADNVSVTTKLRY